MELNNTPVRTSRSFGINNIEINDLMLPKMKKEFENIEITNDGFEINNETHRTNLNYGIGIENIIEKYINHNIKLNANKIKQDIKIIYNFDDENTQLVNNIQIDANENTTSNIIIEYKSETENECFKSDVIRLNAKNNSNVNIIIVNLMNENSNLFLTIENVLENNANVNYTIIDFGGKISLQNYYSNILGEKANNELNAIYLGRNSQIKDINYIVDLRGKKSNVDIDVQGAISDKCKKHFKGTIDFKKGCKKSKGNENEFCFLLSDEAKSIALPMLLCTEEDVEGNHSTASGKVDNKELFYITTRGFSKEEAIKLIVRARFNNIIDKISDENIKQEVINEINNKL